jgi:hypothetical protein
MKRILTAVLALLVFETNATPVYPFYQDVKFPRQAVLEKQTFSIPALADDDLILNDQATSDSATTSVTSFLAQPDVCRALAILPGGTTADVPAGNVTVTGTNINGKVISETFAFLANASTVTNGVKAFCTVESIVFPVQDGAAATYSVGTQDKLGVRKCASNAGAYAWSVFNGAYETTRGVLTADADEVEKNLFDPNGTLDGAKDVELYFVQNYACY